MSLRLVGWCLVWGFVAWWVIENPQDAGHLVHGTGQLAAHAARSVSTMIKAI